MEKTIRTFLKKKPGYLKKSDAYILERLGYYPHTERELRVCAKIRREIINESKQIIQREKPYVHVTTGYATKEDHKRYHQPSHPSFDPNNILVIGDLHEPFCLDGYLEHCKAVQKKHNCGTVIFIGDVIDNHYASYHETDPDGYGAGEELDRAIDKIAHWYDAFPNATVLIGNHDRLIYRKAYTSGLSKRWIRGLNEVLNAPGWNFVEDIVINNISFNHGEGGTAKNRMKHEMQSQVQGHLHSQFYIEYNVSPIAMLFGMQVGCGIDRKAYAMAYGKNYKKPIIGCGAIIDGTPLLEPMILND